MARPREFDPKEALQTAIEVFWEKGYYDGSVDEVVKRSGVAKYGIYGTFGTKRELFITALTQYVADRRQDAWSPLRQPDASLPEILEFFGEVPKITTRKNQTRGCLICNTAIELGLRDPEIRDLVKGFFRDFARILQRCLERAVANGQLDEPTDVAGLATFLITEFRAALMLAAGGHSRRDIERHLDVALRVLH